MAVVNGIKKRQGSSVTADVRLRLDAYAHGDCDYETLAAAIKVFCKVSDDSVWEVLSVLDQHHRRGTLADEVFRSLKAMVSYIALGPPLAVTRKPAPRAKQRPAATGATAAKPAAKEASPSTQHSNHSVNHSTGASDSTNSIREEPVTRPVAERPTAQPANTAQPVGAVPRAASPNTTPSNTVLPNATINDAPELTAEEFLTRVTGAPLFRLLPDETTDEAEHTQHTAPEQRHEAQPRNTANAAATTAAFDPPTRPHEITPPAESTRVRSEQASLAAHNDNADSNVDDNIDDIDNLGIDKRELNTRQTAIAKSVIPGRVLHDRYAIESALAFGRGTAVFRVRDQFRTQDERRLAVKVLLLPHASKDASAQFENELRIAQQLAHNDIVKVFDLDRDGDLLFYSMELIEGQTLNDLLQDSPPKRPQAMAILTQVAHALNYLHDRDIVHGDVHPDNILISATGQVKLLDFGAATEQHTSKPWLMTAGDVSSSYLLYASCERLQGLAADKRDDIFSLSCIAYELLGHEHPFRGKLANQAREAQQAVPRLQELSSRQWRSVQQGLAWTRDARPQSVRDWLAGLESNNGNHVAAAVAEQTPHAEVTAATHHAASAMDDESITATPVISAERRRAPAGITFVAPPAPAKRGISTTWYVVIVVAVLAALAFAFLRFDFDEATAPALAQAQQTVKHAIDTGFITPDRNDATQPSSTDNPASVAASTSHSRAYPTAAVPPSAGVAPAAHTDNEVASSNMVVSSAPAPLPSTEASASTSSVASADAITSRSSDVPTVAATAAASKLDAKANKPVETRLESHGRIGFAQDTYLVGKRDGAARIKLKRDGGAAGRVTFTWWAEAGTAEIGKDFMSLGKKTETLENGEREITVFVPLIASSDNDNRHVFFVELSDPSNGLGIGRITRARVVISDE